MDKAYFEIKRQYKLLDMTIKYIRSKKDELKRFYREKKPGSVLFMGSGSSYSIAKSAEIIARDFGMNSMSVPAGDLMVNFDTYREAVGDSMAVIISRSGNTTEILRSADMMKSEFNAPVLAVTCVEDSHICETADLCLKMPWDFDESVCQTGTVTNLYSAVALIASIFAGHDEMFTDMENMTSSGDKFMGKYEPAFKDIAKRDWNKAVVLADGEISGIADEGALAFKEISNTDSNYYHLLDVRHGPMVMVDKSTLVVADLKPENKEYQLELIKDIAGKGAVIVVCTDESYGEIKDAALHVVHKNAGNAAEGLPFINTIQLIAYHKAIIKGIDPGNPEGLDAWIKL